MRPGPYGPGGPSPQVGAREAPGEKVRVGGKSTLVGCQVEDLGPDPEGSGLPRGLRQEPPAPSGMGVEELGVVQARTKTGRPERPCQSPRGWWGDI